MHIEIAAPVAVHVMARSRTISTSSRPNTGSFSALRRDSLPASALAHIECIYPVLVRRLGAQPAYHHGAQLHRRTQDGDPACSAAVCSRVRHLQQPISAYPTTTASLEDETLSAVGATTISASRSRRVLEPADSDLPQDTELPAAVGAVLGDGSRTSTRTPVLNSHLAPAPSRNGKNQSQGKKLPQRRPPAQRRLEADHESVEFTTFRRWRHRNVLVLRDLAPCGSGTISCQRRLFRFLPAIRNRGRGLPAKRSTGWG